MRIPHAEWCEFCVKGRARNRPHYHKPRGSCACTASPSRVMAEELGEPPKDEEQKLSDVPKISMDCFFSWEVVGAPR